MTPINWRATQTKLGLAPDGIPGRQTYGALLRLMGPTTTPAVIASLANAAVIHFQTYGIDASVDRLADFLAQTANETGGYTRFDEDLRYSAATMLRQWPCHFTAEQAAHAVGNPVEIASRAYGGRMGNMPYPSREGYDARGMGMIQLTGMDNRRAADKRLGIGLDTNPEIAMVPALSLLIACDFYQHNDVLEALDARDFTKARRLTNGGSIGLDNVNKLRAKVMAVLA